MRSDNLQLPCVHPLTSSYNLQLPHDGHHCCHDQGGHGDYGSHDGQDGTGQNLTFDI